MKLIFKTALALFTGMAFIISSCKMSCTKGSGHVVSENRKVADFTKLDISGSYNVELVQDSSLNVSISVDDNLLKQISTEVSGDKLNIKTENNICPSGQIVVTIGVRNLDEIDQSGAINLTTKGKLVTKNLGMNLAGSGNLTMNLDAANLNTTASGTVELNLKGQATSHSMNLSGEGKIHAFDFVVGNYDLETSGAGDFEINVLHELTVNSSGATAVKYKGNPTTINNKKSGVSTITKVN